jgi:hypothetical protein
MNKDTSLNIMSYIRPVHVSLVVLSAVSLSRSIISLLIYTDHVPLLLEACSVRLAIWSPHLTVVPES